MPATGVGAVLVCTSVLTGAVLTVPAPAATKAKPVCRIITDPRGDAAWQDRVPGGPTDDLLSADLSSDGRTVTAVFRMAAVAPSDPTAPTGHAYVFSFRVRGSAAPLQFLNVRTHATGTRYAFGYFTSDATGVTRAHAVGEARGVVDPAKREVRVHAPAARFLPQALRRGLTLSDLSVSVYRWWGQGAVDDTRAGPVTLPFAGTGFAFDHGDGNRYVVGTASCVRPGV